MLVDFFFISLIPTSNISKKLPTRGPRFLSDASQLQTRKDTTQMPSAEHGCTCTDVVCMHHTARQNLNSFSTHNLPKTRRRRRWAFAFCSFAGHPVLGAHGTASDNLTLRLRVSRLSPRLTSPHQYLHDTRGGISSPRQHPLVFRARCSSPQFARTKGSHFYFLDRRWITPYLAPRTDPPTSRAAPLPPPKAR
jgi:hypothetical protein